MRHAGIPSQQCVAAEITGEREKSMAEAPQLRGKTCARGATLVALQGRRQAI